MSGQAPPNTWKTVFPGPISKAIENLFKMSEEKLLNSARQTRLPGSEAESLGRNEAVALIMRSKMSRVGATSLDAKLESLGWPTLKDILSALSAKSEHNFYNFDKVGLIDQVNTIVREDTDLLSAQLAGEVSGENDMAEAPIVESQEPPTPPSGSTNSSQSSGDGGVTASPAAKKQSPMRKSSQDPAANPHLLLKQQLGQQQSTSISAASVAGEDPTDRQNFKNSFRASPRKGSPGVSTGRSMHHGSRATGLSPLTKPDSVEPTKADSSTGSSSNGFPSPSVLGERAKAAIDRTKALPRTNYDATAASPPLVVVRDPKKWESLYEESEEEEIDDSSSSDFDRDEVVAGPTGPRFGSPTGSRLGSPSRELGYGDRNYDVHHATQLLQRAFRGPHTLNCESRTSSSQLGLHTANSMQLDCDYGDDVSGRSRRDYDETFDSGGDFDKIPQTAPLRGVHQSTKIDHDDAQSDHSDGSSDSFELSFSASIAKPSDASASKKEPKVGWTALCEVDKEHRTALLKTDEYGDDVLSPDVVRLYNMRQDGIPLNRGNKTATTMNFRCRMGSCRYCAKVVSEPGSGKLACMSCGGNWPRCSSQILMETLRNIHFFK